VQQEWHVVALDLQIALVNVRCKRQGIQFFRVADCGARLPRGWHIVREHDAAAICHTGRLDALPFAFDIYKRDLQIERYNVPFCCTRSSRFTRRAAARRLHLLHVAADDFRPRMAHAFRGQCRHGSKKTLEYFRR